MHPEESLKGRLNRDTSTPFYEYRHVVTLEETNATGNVYFVNHLRWHGRCRELFLTSFAPGVLQPAAEGLVLITTRASCEFLSECLVFDVISTRMWLMRSTRTRLELRFESWLQPESVRLAVDSSSETSPASEERLISTGTQEIACMRRIAGGTLLVPVPLPDELAAVLSRLHPGSRLGGPLAKESVAEQ